MERFYPKLADGFAGLLAAEAGRPIAVIGHSRPDGDCIGAQVGLARVLRARGRTAVCVNPDPVPRRLQFLLAGENFLRADDALPLSDDHRAIFVDCADGGRAGKRLSERFGAPLGNLDHHLSNPGFASINLVDSGSAASCEILAGLILDAGLPLDAPSAQALYAGILTDTGQFRFGSTSRRCFVLAGELVSRGADPANAGFELYERESIGKFRLLQRFLASLHLECGGRICMGMLPDGIYAETGTSGEDAEGLVDYARSIDGVDIGVLIELRPDGAVKASLRAKDPACRLDLVAAQFGGGGHACAAGLNLSPAPADFRARLSSVLAGRLAEIDAAKRK